MGPMDRRGARGESTAHKQLVPSPRSGGPRALPGDRQEAPRGRWSGNMVPRPGGKGSVGATTAKRGCLSSRAAGRGGGGRSPHARCRMIVKKHPVGVGRGTHGAATRRQKKRARDDGEANALVGASARGQCEGGEGGSHSDRRSRCRRRSAGRLFQLRPMVMVSRGCQNPRSPGRLRFQPPGGWGACACAWPLSAAAQPSHFPPSYRMGYGGLSA